MACICALMVHRRSISTLAHMLALRPEQRTAATCAGRAAGALPHAAAWLRHAHLRAHVRRSLQRQAAELAAGGAGVAYVPVASPLRSALRLWPRAGVRPALLVLSRDALMLEAELPGGGREAGAGLEDSRGRRCTPPALMDAHTRVHKQQLGMLLTDMAENGTADERGSG